MRCSLVPFKQVRRGTEDREIAAGISSSGRLLLVSFTQRGDSIRIISACKLTAHERRLYEEEELP
ncbi:MAG: BrnT family toxin [Thermoanaerobaculia bacterium]